MIANAEESCSNVLGITVQILPIDTDLRSREAIERRQRRMRRSNPGTQPVRRFPYYKLQHFDDRVAAWMDVQIRFESRDQLLDHALSSLEDEARIRIVKVEGYRRRRILEDCGTVADCRSNRKDK